MEGGRTASGWCSLPDTPKAQASGAELMVQHADFGHQSTLKLTQIPQDLLLQLIVPVSQVYADWWRRCQVLQSSHMVKAAGGEGQILVCVQ